METPQASENEAEPTDKLVIQEVTLPNEDENVANISGSSKGSEVENLDNIKKFIEAQERDIQDNKDKNIQNHGRSLSENTEKPVESREMHGGNLKIELDNLEHLDENVKNSADNIEMHVHNIDDETMAVASSVMEMILSETEANVVKSNTIQVIPKQAINPGK